MTIGDFLKILGGLETPRALEMPEIFGRPYGIMATDVMMIRSCFFLPEWSFLRYVVDASTSRFMTKATMIWARAFIRPLR